MSFKEALIIRSHKICIVYVLGHQEPQQKYFIMNYLLKKLKKQSIKIQLAQHKLNTSSL